MTVTRYGKTETIAVHALTCLWYSVTGTAPVTVILIRDKSKTGFDLALITTEKNPDIAAVIERYAARWSIEVAIEDAKQLFGTGQAGPQPHRGRGRAHDRVHARLPGHRRLLVRHRGYHPADTETRRLNAPWYTSKTEPSTADMTAKLRRVIIAAEIKRFHADQPEPAEIHAIRLAWADAEDSPPKPRSRGAWHAVENMPRYRELNAELVEEVGVPNSSVVLDIGSGAGAVSAIVLDREPTAALWAVDPAPEMLSAIPPSLRSRN